METPEDRTRPPNHFDFYCKVNRIDLSKQPEGSPYEGGPIVIVRCLEAPAPEEGTPNMDGGDQYNYPGAYGASVFFSCESLRAPKVGDLVMMRVFYPQSGEHPEYGSYLYWGEDPTHPEGPTQD